MLDSRRPVWPRWHWLGSRRVKRPQSRAWKVLATVRVDGDMVAWEPQEALKDHRRLSNRDGGEGHI